MPILLAIGIDRIAAGNLDLLLPIAGIFGAVLGRFVVVSAARYLVRTSGIRVSFDLRQALFNALQHQGGSFFNRYTIGDMMTRAVADIALVQRLIAMGTILLVILVYATLVGFGFMLYLSPSLTLLLLPPMPFVFFYARWASHQMGIASKDVQDRMSDLADHVQENLSGIRTIQAMVQEENEVKRFLDTNQAYSNAFYQQARINSLMAAWMPTLAAVCSITIIGYGGYLVMEGELSIGQLVAFLMYVNMVVQPFRVAGFVISLFQRAAVASDRLFEVLSLSPEITDAPTGAAPAQIRGDIEPSAISPSAIPAMKPKRWPGRIISRSEPASASRSWAGSAPANRRCSSSSCGCSTPRPGTVLHRRCGRSRLSPLPAPLPGRSGASGSVSCSASR